MKAKPLPPTSDPFSLTITELYDQSSGRSHNLLIIALPKVLTSRMAGEKLVVSCQEPTLSFLVLTNCVFPGRQNLIQAPGISDFCHMKGKSKTKHNIRRVPALCFSCRDICNMSDHKGYSETSSLHDAVRRRVKVATRLTRVPQHRGGVEGMDVVETVPAGLILFT